MEVVSSLVQIANVLIIEKKYTLANVTHAKGA